MHLCTSNLWFSLKFYRACFKAIFDWQAIRIPFSDLVAYKSSVIFSQDKLKRIGLHSIGRDIQVS